MKLPEVLSSYSFKTALSVSVEGTDFDVDLKALMTTIGEQERALHAKDEVIRGKDKALAEKDTIIDQQSLVIAEQKNALPCWKNTFVLSVFDFMVVAPKKRACRLRCSMKQNAWMIKRKRLMISRSRSHLLKSLVPKKVASLSPHHYPDIKSTSTCAKKTKPMLLTPFTQK